MLALREAPAALALFDGRQRVVASTFAFDELFGLGAGGSTGKSLQELLGGPFSEAADVVRTALEAGAAASTIIERGRSPRHLRLHATPVPLEAGAGALLTAAVVEPAGPRASAELPELIELLPIPAALLSARDLRYQRVNPPYRALFEDRELLGHSAWLLHPDLEQHGLLAIAARAAATGERFSATELQLSFEDRRGLLRERFFSVLMHPLRDEGGEPDRLLLLLNDVSEQVLARRRTERLAGELQRMDAMLRSLAGVARVVVWGADFDGHLRPSPAWAEVTGLPEAGLAGEGWLAVVSEGQREEARRAWSEAVRSQAPFARDLRVRRRGGPELTFQLRAALARNADGSPREWIGTAVELAEADRRDDPARLEQAWAELSASLDAEEVLDALARNAVGALGDAALVDLWGERGLQTVRRAQRSEGRTEVRRLEGTLRSGPALEAIARRERAELLPNPQEALGASANGLDAGSALAAPLQIRGQPLGVLTVLARAPLRYGAAELRCAEGLARRAALALDHARLYGESQASNRAKDEFLAAVSHELRTPLTAILGWSRLLRLKPAEPMLLERALSTIERNAQMQAELVEDLLDLTRAASGRLRLNAVELDPRAPVQAAIDAARPMADARSVQLALEVAPGLPAILGDGERLRQVVWNLLTNAVKSSKAGDTVRVRLEVEGPRVAIRVEDQGVGIGREALGTLFARLDVRRAKQGEQAGLGLGLALVRRFTELHGGEVRAESDGPGQGARFTVLLPALLQRPTGPDAPLEAPGASEQARAGRPVS